MTLQKLNKILSPSYLDSSGWRCRAFLIPKSPQHTTCRTFAFLWVGCLDEITFVHYLPDINIASKNKHKCWQFC